MDHTMVLSYNYSNQNRWRRRTNAPPSWVISMAMAVCCAHRLMQHDQGFTGSHWTSPSGNYSLCITQAATRATINTTMMQHVPTLLAVSMAIAMWRYYTARIARWRRFVALIKANICRHRVSTCSNNTQSDMPAPVVLDISP